MLSILMACLIAHAADDSRPIDIDEAEELETLTDEQLEWLKPRRSRLPQNPYQHIDFTAYTLEQGEVQLGLSNMIVGVRPRLQLGTSVPLDMLRIPNFNVKGTIVHSNDFDLALLGSAYVLPVSGFTGARISIGSRGSWQIQPAWSAHLSTSYRMFQADGVPDLRPIANILSWISGNSIESYSVEILDENSSLHFRAQTIDLAMATDIRFNRRDSLILFGSIILWQSRDNELLNGEVPPLFNLDQIFVPQSGLVSLRDSFVTSLAYQLSWPRLGVRMGIGTSAVPAAWLLQTIELSYRLGGETRQEENRIRKGWRQNQQLIDQPEP